MTIFPFATPTYASCGGANFDLVDCLTLGNSSTVADTYQTPADLINVIVPNVMILAGLIFLVALFYGGFKMIQDDSKGKDEARAMITTALLGMAVMFSAYWIVQIVGLITGVDFSFL